MSQRSLVRSVGLPSSARTILGLPDRELPVRARNRGGTKIARTSQVGDSGLDPPACCTRIDLTSGFN